MDNGNLETAQLYSDIFEAASDGILIADINNGSILAANPVAAAMHGYLPEAIQKLQIRELVHSESLPLFNVFEQKIKKKEVFEILAQHVRLDTSIIYVEWRAGAFTFQGKQCALAILRDVTKRVQLENSKNHRMLLRTHEQAAMVEISRVFAATLELQPEMILDQLKILIKYSFAGFFMLEDDTLVSKAIRGTHRLGKTTPWRIPLTGKAQLEELFNNQSPILIGDSMSENGSAKLLHALFKTDHAMLLETVHSWLWAPLTIKNRVLGGIGIAHTARNFFTKHDAGLAMTIANQAAVTIANTELHEQAQALAGLQERQRLAQNLHDAINQSLFSGGLIAEVLPRLWERNPTEALQSLEDLRRLIRGAQAEMRSLLGELRPAVLVDNELADLLILLGHAFAGRTNIPVEVISTGKCSLPSETQITIYRVCQEALNNIAKHAQASQVKILLDQSQDSLKLQIIDNGIGFTFPLKSQAGHFGLEMMQERSEKVGTTLRIISTPGEGTEIQILWKDKEKSWLR